MTDYFKVRNLIEWFNHALAWFKPAIGGLRREAVIGLIHSRSAAVGDGH
jgi:hypothetical protein